MLGPGRGGERRRLRFAWRRATAWARLEAILERCAKDSVGGVVVVMVGGLGGLLGVMMRAVFVCVAGL